jgi:hypothetical protein
MRASNPRSPLASVVATTQRACSLYAIEPPCRGPRYERELALVADGETRFVEHADLLDF